MKTLALRRATLADAAPLASLEVRAWQWAYRDLLPDAFLAHLSVADTEASLRAQLGPADPRHTWLAEVAGAPLGFITSGPADDPALPPDTGKIFALYQESRAAGTGVGRALAGPRRRHAARPRLHARDPVGAREQPARAPLLRARRLGTRRRPQR